MKKKDQKLYNKWWFWTVIGALLLVITAVVLYCSGILGSGQRVTICTEIEGNAGPCTKKETVEIVAKPDKQTGCPAGTKPVYNSVGGIVGIEFVGCAKE